MTNTNRKQTGKTRETQGRAINLGKTATQKGYENDCPMILFPETQIWSNTSSNNTRITGTLNGALTMLLMPRESRTARGTCRE